MGLLANQSYLALTKMTELGDLHVKWRTTYFIMVGQLSLPSFCSTVVSMVACESCAGHYWLQYVGIPKQQAARTFEYKVNSTLARFLSSI